ncbi:MAG: hypothetical protein IJQ59_06150 [Bacteroidaceae bacterium]|nr:hypothetical protein [Bacteroidaceae bacterium]
MAKTPYQEAATEYVREYLEHLLKMEDILSHNLDNRIEHAVKRYLEDNTKDE